MTSAQIAKGILVGGFAEIPDRQYGIKKESKYARLADDVALRALTAPRGKATTLLAGTVAKANYIGQQLRERLDKEAFKVAVRGKTVYVQALQRGI